MSLSLALLSTPKTCRQTRKTASVSSLLYLNQTTKRHTPKEDEWSYSGISQLITGFPCLWSWSSRITWEPHSFQRKPIRAMCTHASLLPPKTLSSTTSNIRSWPKNDGSEQLLHRQKPHVSAIPITEIASAYTLLLTARVITPLTSYFEGCA